MPDLSFAVSAPLRLDYNKGSSVSVCEWSLAGLKISSFSSQLKRLPKKGNLVIRFQGIDISLPVTFKVSKDREMLQFVDLSGRQRETLAIFYRSILSGKMASTNDIITSLDTPVDLVPMGETEEEREIGVQKAKPREFRALWNLIVYLALGIFVVSAVGTQIWSRINTVHLEHARIIAPEVLHAAPDGAFVQEILVEPGTAVHRGDTLIHLNDPRKSGGIEDVRSEIKLAERRLRQIREQLSNHEAKRAFFRLPVLRAYLDAVAQRQIHDFYGDYNLHVVRLTWAALAAFDANKSALPGDFQDIRDQIRTRLDEQKLELKRLKRELSNKKNGARAFDIIASTDGTIQQVLVLDNQFVRRGELAIVIEENAPRFAIGWLDDTQAGRIFVGMKAEITFSSEAQKKTVPGKVSNIEAGSDPARPDKFGMIVTVVPDDVGLEQSRILFSQNAPVRIALSRDLLRRSQQHGAAEQ